MAVVLELMAQSGKTVSQLRQEIPTYHVVKDKLRIRADQAPLVIRALRREYADREVNLLDGVYVDFGDSWVHARRSNTEPVVRITAEARSEDEARRLAADLRAKVEKAL